MILTPDLIQHLVRYGLTTGDINALMSGHASARTSLRGPKLPRSHASQWRRSLGHWKFADASVRQRHDVKWALVVRFVPDETGRPTSYSFRRRWPRLAEAPSPRRNRRLLALFTRAAGC